MTAGLAGSELAAGYARGLSAASLSERLTALARLVQIGSARARAEGFSRELLQESEDLLVRAGERLRMSAEHTVVVFAGGTGSGKSSLFNRLAGADFSPVGMVRPVTRTPHACVWDMEGAGPLLDWIGVQARNRYDRSSALDEGERGLTGLVLIDLPDHDSVLADRPHGVDRLVSLADLMVWVLDPQKYADAAVHSRYLVPMAGHSGVMAVVLNQADLLAPDQVDDCVADLQRLLDAEGLHETRILVTSAATGAGIEELRTLLTDAVSARRSMVERISADVDALAQRFTPYGGGEDDADVQDAGEPPATVPGASEADLNSALGRACGIAGICRTLQSVRELKAADYVGWPISWLVSRAMRRDPARAMRLGALWDELRGVSAGPADAQAAEIDNAVTALGDTISSGLPGPWSATVRAAARSRIDDVAGALGAAVAQALPAENRAAPWWRLAAVWQGLLLGGVVTGLAWLAGLLAVGVFHVSRHGPAIFTTVALMPWVVGLVAGFAALGWLSALACTVAVARAAGREREQVSQQMRERVAEVTRQMVVVPVERELSEYARFRDELVVARGLS